jgi:predicted dehydrogenase
MSEIKVILLGTSHPHIYHRYAYFQQHPDITLLGYYDSNPDVAERMKAHTGCPLYTEPDDLISLSYDVAFIHGQDHENAEYMRLALESGARGIFVEKPGVAQPVEFYSLAPQISKHGIIFEVGWELHYLETVERARQIIRESLLGSITLARFHGGCPGGAGAEPWQSDKRNIGGFFYSLGGHVLEIVVDLFGLPIQVISSVRKLPEQKPHRGYSWVPGLFQERELNPEKAIGTLVYEDITSAILEYEAFNVHLDFTAWEASRYLRDWSVEIYGTEGSLHLNIDGPGSYLLSKENKNGLIAGQNVLFEKEVNLSAAFRKQMDTFFQRIRNGNIEGEYCDQGVALKLLRLYNALYESSRIRQWVSM